MSEASHSFENRPRKKKDQNSSIPSGVITAYVYGRLTADQKKRVDEMLNSSGELREKVQKKELERMEMLQQIPNRNLTANARRSLSSELWTITMEVMPEDKLSLWEKIVKFFDKTLIEF